MMKQKDKPNAGSCIGEANRSGLTRVRDDTNKHHSVPLIMLALSANLLLWFGIIRVIPG